jgi:hypothetical protein
MLLEKRRWLLLIVPLQKKTESVSEKWLCPVKSLKGEALNGETADHARRRQAAEIGVGL